MLNIVVTQSRKLPNRVNFRPGNGTAKDILKAVVESGADLSEFIRNCVMQSGPQAIRDAAARHAQISRSLSSASDCQPDSTPKPSGASLLTPGKPALRPWLAPAGPTDAPIIDARKTAVDHWLKGFLRAEPSSWAQNCLRHSWISYRLALTKSAAQAALEAGTSERKIFAHYRQLVTEDAAQRWFSGAPKSHQEPSGEAVSG